MAQTVYNPNTLAGGSANTNQMIATYNQIAAGAVGSHTFFTAPYACVIQSISFIYHTGAGATSTVSITKDTSTGAPGSGSQVMTALDMNTTVDTVYNAVLASASTITLAAGDRLATKVASGTATGTADFNITVALTRA